MQVCGFLGGPKLDEEPDNVFRVSSRLNSTWGGSLVDMVRSRRYLEIIAEEDLSGTRSGWEPICCAGSSRSSSRARRALERARHGPDVRHRPARRSDARPGRRRGVRPRHDAARVRHAQRALPPPLDITVAEIDEALGLFARGVEQVTAKPA